MTKNWPCLKRSNFFLLFFNTPLFPCGKSGPPYLGKATVAARAALLIPSNTCSISVYFCVSKQWWGCQCLGFLTCAQMLMHAIAHRGCANTLHWKLTQTGRKIPLLHQGIKPTTVLHLTFWPDTLANMGQHPQSPSPKWEWGLVCSFKERLMDAEVMDMLDTLPNPWPYNSVRKSLQTSPIFWAAL